MVANEIAGSGQVDVFLLGGGGTSRWTTSSSTTGITSMTCHTASRLSGTTSAMVGDRGGGGVGTTASAPTTTPPPSGETLNWSRQHDGQSQHSRVYSNNDVVAFQRWADTRQHQSADIGPSETDEKGLAQLSSSSSSSSSVVLDRIQPAKPTSVVSVSVSVQRLVSSSNDGLRINHNCSDQHSSDGDDSVIETEIHQQPTIGKSNAIQVNDALDAPQKSNDQQHDDKMPRHSYDSGSVQQQHQQHAQWGGGGDGDEINNTSSSLSSSSSSSCGRGGGGGGVPLKSALKRPTVGRSGGVAGTLQQLQSLRKKSRVRFNEALNTFLECDYVIYVDDDEYDLLYHLDAVAAAAAAAAAAQAEFESADPAHGSLSTNPVIITTTEQPQLVNVRSFELQLPETSTCVSHATVPGSGPPTVVVPPPSSSSSTGDAGTLSPPDGYKDAAAFYAAAAALVDLENHHHLSGFTDDGVDPWESEDYDDEEAMADEAEALDNGWMDSQLVEESPKSHANHQQQLQLQQQQQQQQQPMSDVSAVGSDPLPDPPRTGILKGGKLWRGAVNNNNDSSHNNSSSTSSSSSSTGPCSSSIGGGGEEGGTLSRHGEKSPAVRFIHLNDAHSGGGGGDAENVGANNATATGGLASGGGGQSSTSQRSGLGGGGGGTGHHHNSAFQQLFPRARKLLQELPEAEIQRLTTAARANNVASFSSTRTGGITSLLGHDSTAATTTDTTDASDLKYEKALRVTEVTEDADESHGGASGGANAAAAARLGVQYSADYYQIIKRIRSASAETARQQQQQQQQQRKTDTNPPTAADSLVERLKWLTTTDVDDETTEESTGVAEEREAADGGSDLEMAAMQLAAYASVPLENAEQIRDVGEEEDDVHYHHQTSLRSASGTGEACQESTSNDASSASVVVTNNKPGGAKSGGSGEKSTYRKLNELFFRTKSKDKNKDTNKSSNSALNRSFSPPPPAEVEPKMKPSKKQQQQQQQSHLIHIVGLAGKSSASSSTPTGALSSSGASGTETLGRIPNVVPTVDHVYRAAVDLVTRNTSGQQQQHQTMHINHPVAGFVHSGVVIQGPSANDSYSLDDIDAALHAQISAAAAAASSSSSSGSVGATEANASQCLYLMPANHRIPEDSRDETGGSRSSGSSGDSGLGLSSHDTSLTGMSDTATDAGCVQDELQAFVRQDATQGRIDRIKKRYSAALEPDEAEDYGFLRRPSVRGIKTKFGSTSEIIQQMQAQLAGPMPAVTAARASGQTHVNWSSYAEQSSIQAEALLDPREKRRSAMMAMSNSVHLPALPEDAGYFHQQHQQLLHSAGSAHPNAVAVTNRPSSVMNIYGSTGDLYQHLRAPMRPVMVRHPPTTSSSSIVVPGAHPPQLLERTSSVSSVSSAIDASAVYGTIRRQPQMMQHPSYSHPALPDSLSPTRDYAPAIMMQQHSQQLLHQQQQQHHQLPLRMTVSTPAGPYMAQQQQQQQQRPVSQQMLPAGSVAYYATPQEYALQQQLQQQQQQFQMQQQQQQQHYVYATLPGKRQSPYGVPANIPVSVGSQVVVGTAPTVLDPTRYRQVLPPMTSQVTLRPSSALADPRYSSVGHLQPPPPPHHPQQQQQQQQPAAPTLKDEREGPEGASSSPGLTHHDVNM